MKKINLGWFVAGSMALCLFLFQTPGQAAVVPNVTNNTAPVVEKTDVPITTKVVVGSNDASVVDKKTSTPITIKATGYTLEQQSASLPKVAAVSVPATNSRHTIYQYMPDSSKSFSTENKLSEISKDVAGKVYYELKESGQKYLASNVAVVAAVPLSDLKRETEFGRLMAEYNLTDLADRGLRVKELRMGKDINILPQTGEFILSRNVGEIANDSPAIDYVVVSTFTNTRKTLILQGRLVSLKTGLIKTAWRYDLPLNRELLGLLYTKERQPFKIAVKGFGK